MKIIATLPIYQYVSLCICIPKRYSSDATQALIPARTIHPPRSPKRIESLYDFRRVRVKISLSFVTHAIQKNGTVRARSMPHITEIFSAISTMLPSSNGSVV